MATKRQRGAVWAYVVKRKGLLPRPLTFASEEEGDGYVKKLEALLDRGVLPDEFRAQQGEIVTVEDAAREYLAAQHVPESEKRCLAVVVTRIGATRVRAINYKWAESWVTAMKREQNLSPVTIRHHVGALARCFDWGTRHSIAALAVNPLRLLPRATPPIPLLMQKRRGCSMARHARMWSAISAYVRAMRPGFVQFSGDSNPRANSAPWRFPHRPRSSACSIWRWRRQCGCGRCIRFPVTSST